MAGKLHHIKTLTVLVLLSLLGTGCPAEKTPGDGQPSNKAHETTVTLDTPTKPKQPSDRVGVFYYPWYETPDVDGQWGHWEGGIQHSPPHDIASDYYPVLGAYSSGDPNIVKQHFMWLRQAGVGLVISSWWGPGDYTDNVANLLLDTASEYTLKVTFLLEPRAGRNGRELVQDIRYLYAKYGKHPAFYWTTKRSPWCTNNEPRGVFFIWGGAPEENPKDEPRYWAQWMDRVHAQKPSSFVFYDVTNNDFVEQGHFDGLYNYTLFEEDPSHAYAWARELSPHAWYIPSVMPGFQTLREPKGVNFPRNGGRTYSDQWEAALGTGVEPDLVTITSFNEWHEGTQIEPARPDMTNGAGRTYSDYEALPPEGYLELTAEWIGLRF